jgi:hypothetical protein
VTRGALLDAESSEQRYNERNVRCLEHAERCFIQIHERDVKRSPGSEFLES